MNQTIRFSLKIMIVSLVFHLVVFTNAGLSQSKIEKIDEVVSKYMEYRKFNGTVLVAEKGSVIFKKGYGFADHEWQIPLTTDTKFRLGSITKQFTSMLVLQLVEKGEIELEGNLSDYLPYYRKDIGEKVTIHHLLTHTSGIPSYTGLPDFFDEISRDPYPVKDFVLKYCSNDLEFEPGEMYRYNNSGYFLLGAILEELTGETYEELLKERIFNPLDMKDSGYDHHGTLISKRAKGYQVSGMEIVNAPYLDMSLPYSAGSLYSTVEDLYKWDQALYTDRLLSDEMKEKMYTPFKNNYAYGWGIGKTVGDRKTISHGGGINGFNTLITRVPEDRHLVVALNSMPRANLGEMTNSILAIIYGEEYSFPKRSLPDLIYNEIIKNSIYAAISKVRSLKEKNSDDYDFSLNEFVRSAHLLSSKNRHRDAVMVMDYCIELYPDSYYTYFALGDVYKNSGEKNKAIKNYSKALEKNPNFKQAFNRLRELIDK